MNETWKVGDWAFFEFDLVQITEVEDGRVVGVSNGLISTGGWNLGDRLMPLTMSMKRIAGEFEHHSNRLHREGAPGLNHPDIHRWLSAKWVETCKDAERVDALRQHYADVRKFTNDVLEKQQIDSGYGFELMRTRK